MLPADWVQRLKDCLSRFACEPSAKRHARPSKTRSNERAKCGSMSGRAGTLQAHRRCSAHKGVLVSGRPRVVLLTIMQLPSYDSFIFGLVFHDFSFFY